MVSAISLAVEAVAGVVKSVKAAKKLKKTEKILSTVVEGGKNIQTVSRKFEIIGDTMKAASE